MPASIKLGAFVFGAVLLLIAILGGNFKLFGAEVASTVTSRWQRFASLLLGVLLVVVSLDIPILKVSPFSRWTPSLEPPSQHEHLERYLSAARWADADNETSDLMIALAIENRANRPPEQSWLDPADIRMLPCDELSHINNLWMRSSKGRFGFLPQVNIWTQVGGTAATQPDNPEVRRRFSRAIGWTNADIASLSLIQIFNRIEAVNNRTANLPVGYLPTAVGRYRSASLLVGPYNEFSALAGKARQCHLDA